MSTARTEMEWTLLDRIMRGTGLATTDDAANALEATLVALGEAFATAPVTLPTLASSAAGASPAPRDQEELFARVARHAHLRPGFAREHASVVCRVLGESMSADERRAFARALPPALLTLFAAPEDVDGDRVPPHGVASTEPHHTLASGRPGSRHSLAESAPPGAHRHSVAREENPHADTKLSSASGSTQERLDESLATSHPPSPGAQRSIAERRG